MRIGEDEGFPAGVRLGRPLGRDGSLALDEEGRPAIASVNATWRKFYDHDYWVG